MKSSLSILLLLCALGLSPNAHAQGIAWEKRFGWLGDDQLFDVIGGGNDSVFVACGTSYSYGIDDLGGTHHQAITVLCFNAKGDTLWHLPLPFYGGAPLLCPGDSEGFFMVATSFFTPPLNYNGYLALLNIGYDGQILSPPVRGLTLEPSLGGFTRHCCWA